MPPEPTDLERAEQLEVAMSLLWWSVRDLYIAAIAIGDVGPEIDLRDYLQTGVPVEVGRFAAIAANEGLREHGIEYRVDEEGDGPGA